MRRKDKKRSLSLCFFGTYESTFPRSITLKQACRLRGIRVIDCHFPFWERKKEKLELFSAKSIAKMAFQLIFIYLRLAIRYLRLEDHEALIVGYNGYLDMPLARLLASLGRKPLIYTPVFPLYETAVEDRGYINRKSLKSRAIHLIDEFSCCLADLIIIETETYMNYYCQEFKVPREKFFKIPLGADEANFHPHPQKPQKSNSQKLKILFYGKFIPLQGIPYIVKAAKLLERQREIEFKIIGSGQLTEEIRNLARKLEVKNINFIDWVNYSQLPRHIQEADICLGIFGDTPKAQRGIPIKIYEALAMQKAVITGRSPAAQEVFTHGVDSMLCEMANPEALAESILKLKQDRKLRERIAEEGFKLYQNLFSSSRIAEEFEKALNRCL